MSTRQRFKPLVRRVVQRTASTAVVAVAAVVRASRTPANTPWREPPSSILVIRLDLLGDVIFTLGGVAMLRRAFPQAHIAMLTLPYTAPLVDLYDMVDEVIAVDTNRIRTVRGLLHPATWLGYLRAWRRVRALRPDVAVSVSGRMASLCALLSGAQRTVGYAGEAYPFTLNDPVAGRRYSIRKHEVEYVRALAAHAGGSGEIERLPSPRVPTGGRVEQLLERAGVRPTARLVIVHAGAINGSAKRWLPGYWAEFGSRLQSNADVCVVLVGSRSDEPIARQVLDAAPNLHSLVGRTSIQELVALVARADLVVTGDSGPLHLAVALGRPLVAVYGPTDPQVYGPYRPQAPARVHRADLPCSPCYAATAPAECPLGFPICMQLVSPGAMLSSAQTLLAPVA